MAQRGGDPPHAGPPHAGPPHAGPPFVDPGAVSAVIRNSAAQCRVHDGWTAGMTAAFATIDRGVATLRPVQDRNVATPLAEVASLAATGLLGERLNRENYRN